MRRALQLAGNGEGRVSPNPMVGAVIVHGTRIIGEGYHAFFGGPHAEVNAINSVRESDRHLLKDSTMYVTLEPCAHHGKTPPCANLIVETGIPRVVIGSPDPNPKVAGKGVKILRKAGVEVTEGMMRKECDDLNRRFLFAQLNQRPYIQLKWAQSADGYIDGAFSTPLSKVWMHRERCAADAIMVGGNTERMEQPLLTNRLWGGNSPQKFVAHFHTDLRQQLEDMRKAGINSLMVEGGAMLLEYFIKQGLYDEIRREISPDKLGSGIKAPVLPKDIVLSKAIYCRKNLIEVYLRENLL